MPVIPSAQEVEARWSKSEVNPGKTMRDYVKNKEQKNSSIRQVVEDFPEQAWGSEFNPQ
jgi:hypothetical protein